MAKLGRHFQGHKGRLTLQEQYWKEGEMLILDTTFIHSTKIRASKSILDEHVFAAVACDLLPSLRWCLYPLVLLCLPSLSSLSLPLSLILSPPRFVQTSPFRCGHPPSKHVLLCKHRLESTGSQGMNQKGLAMSWCCAFGIRG